MGLAITFFLGVFILIGAAISGFSKNGHRAREISVAVALGAMVTLLVLDLAPEALEASEELGLPLAIGAVIVGFLVLLALDKMLPESAHSHGGSHDHGHACSHDDALHISIAATIAIAAHNLVEGMSVCGVASEDAGAALVLAIGVGIHNIPMGMLIFAGLREESMAKKTGVLAVAALSTFVGGIVMFALSHAVSEAIVLFVVCLTIGLLLYIILMELIPKIVRSNNKKQAVLCVVIGIALVLASSLLGGE